MQHVQPPFRRRISPNERLYLAAERLAPPFAIQVFVEGEGSIDIDQLRRAVAAASRACPGARLIARGKHWIDTGESPRVRSVGQVRDLTAESAPFLWDRLDPYTGPTCEVLLHRGERTTLVFRAFHGVMDGRGVLLWIHEVFRAMRGEIAVGADSTETDLGLLERLGPVTRRPGLRFDTPSPVAAGAVRDTEFQWHRRTVQGGHAGLVAKLAAVLADASDAPSTRVMVPVDMRRHDPALRSTANLSLPIFVDAARGEGWEALHGRILEALADRRELAVDGSEGPLAHAPVWGIGTALKLVLRHQARKQRYLAAAILSHLGRVDLATVSTEAFHASTLYSLPVHAPLAPLSLVAVECPGHVELTLACPRGDGMAAAAEALLDRVEQAIAPDPARRWAGNQSDAPAPTTTASELFAAQARRTPDAVALIAGDQTVTYRELDARVASVASVLAGRGVGPGAIVGVVADRTVDAVAALLGAHRAGAAYVPIDPQYPEERIRFLLADAGAALCLAQRSYAPLVARSYPGEVLILGELPASGDVALPTAAPTDLAYVIYTSGSTGRPKGVEIEHRQLVNYLHWAQQAYEIDGDTRFALFTSLSFDLTITALFLPLIAGGSVALFPEDIDHLALRRIVESSGATALKLTPTHLDLISRLDVAPVGFRTLVVGGEQLKGAVAARTQAVFGPSCRIINEYGPTETTVGCVFHVYDADLDGDVAPVPIGVPAHNTRIVLLDANRRPVASGESGEIYITGDGLARGYRGRPELTRDRFVRLADGTRAYRTGDLARIDDSDLLAYLGRSDDQIKIRGHRIEPGEIEKVLEEHPAIARAVVLGRSRPNQQDRVLCAYLVGAAVPDDAEVRQFLEERVPAFLVPTFFVRVDDIPATVNGKVDVRALPDPFATPGAAAAGARSPRSDLEHAVTTIWSRILDVDADAIHPEADFYVLGGDSLKMVEMLSAVADRMVGAAREESFMRSMRPVIRRPTLANVCRVVQETHGAVPA